MSSFIVIWNSGSGGVDKIVELRNLFADWDTNWIDLDQTDDLVGAVRTATNERESTVIAAGGDGTVNATVNALMAIEPESRPSMGIVPLGTANDFAGTLGIPDDIAEAVALFQHPPIGIDVVKMSAVSFERFYANMAAGGNCVRVSEAMTDEIKSRWGAFSYMRGAVDVLPDMQVYRTQIDCDGERFIDLASWAILVANGKTNAGRIEVAPQASPKDGLFDVIVIRDGTVSDMVEIVANNLLGHFLESDQVIFRQARVLQLQSDPPMRFTIDGEVVDQEPVRFEVVPAAIAMHTGEMESAVENVD